jgi:hypothetical protein
LEKPYDSQEDIVTVFRTENQDKQEFVKKQAAISASKDRGDMSNQASNLSRKALLYSRENRIKYSFNSAIIIAIRL